MGSHPEFMSRGTPKVTLRIPDDLWQRFGAATTAAGTDRATIIRALIKWYLKDEGARLPERGDQ